MSEERLPTGLALASLYRDISALISPNKIINSLVRKHENHHLFECLIQTDI